MKRFFTILCVGMMIIACQEKEEFIVDLRTPNKVEFQERILPEGYVIGAKKPETLEAIDLGLSVKWSNMNLGATTPEETGDLFAWGEIEPKSYYGWSNYEFNEDHNNNTLYLTKYCYDRYGENQDLDKETDNLNLHKYDDAAYMYYGEGFRMPTIEEMQELATKCTWTFETLKEEKVHRCTATGPNGNSIVIIFADSSGQYTPSMQADYGGLWSSTLCYFSSPFAQCMHFNKSGIGIIANGQNRPWGMNIRAVYDK